MKRLLCALALLILNSCQVYRSHFECQPGRGVPCTAVTDIEKMIVETPDGSADIFMGYLPRECASLSQMKIWLVGKEKPGGLYVAGHYIFLNKNEVEHD